jgi:hypothetical protein
MHLKIDVVVIGALALMGCAFFAAVRFLRLDSELPLKYLLEPNRPVRDPRERRAAGSPPDECVRQAIKK